MNKKGVTLVEVIVVITILTIIAAILCGGRGCLVGCDPNYSDGTRVGVVTKFSHKGWSYKTWEGEMNMGGMVSDGQGGSHVSVWKFTVAEEDEENQKKIQDALKTQKQVIVQYSEWRVRPNCQTDSGYIVKSVEFVKPQGK